jgi:hypothetical protein
MLSIPYNDLLAKLPERELQDSLHEFLKPVIAWLPDSRLCAVAELMMRGIVTNQSPIVTQIARGAEHADATVWPSARKRSHKCEPQNPAPPVIRTRIELLLW